MHQEFSTKLKNNLENSKKITVIVYANDASDLAEEKTEFILENYIDGNKPNPDPTNPTNPVDPIDPNPNPINPINPEMPTSGDKKYLVWLLPVIIIPIIGIIIGIVWFYFRFKKELDSVIFTLNLGKIFYIFLLICQKNYIFYTWIYNLLFDTI